MSALAAKQSSLLWDCLPKGTTAPASIQRPASHFRLIDSVALTHRLHAGNLRLSSETIRLAASEKALWMSLFRRNTAMDSDLIIRPSRADDVNAIALIYRHYVLTSSATFEIDPPDLNEIASRRTAILDLGLPYLVAEQGAAVVGYAYAGMYRPRPAYRFTIEDSIYVHPDNLGQGCGSALLQSLIAHCEQGPWRQMIAVIGGADNKASVRLHEQFAFQHIGTLRSVGYKFNSWVDTVLMQRELDASPTTPPLS